MSEQSVTIAVQYVVTVSGEAVVDLFDHELREALTPDVALLNALLEQAGIAAKVTAVTVDESS